MKRYQKTDEALKQVYRLINQTLIDTPGSGAGGGLVAGIAGVPKGKIIHGIDFVLDVLDFDQRAQDTDFIIVGEGRMDQQSMAGKLQ